MLNTNKIKANKLKCRFLGSEIKFSVTIYCPFYNKSLTKHI